MSSVASCDITADMKKIFFVARVYVLSENERERLSYLQFVYYCRRTGSANIRPGYFDEIDRSVFDRFSKRNIDEIDTAFDSFFKRNIDEIDRAGWSGFVKRLDNYLADRQRR